MKWFAEAELVAWGGSKDLEAEKSQAYGKGWLHWTLNRKPLATEEKAEIEKPS